MGLCVVWELRWRSRPMVEVGGNRELNEIRLVAEETGEGTTSISLTPIGVKGVRESAKCQAPSGLRNAIRISSPGLCSGGSLELNTKDVDKGHTITWSTPRHVDTWRREWCDVRSRVFVVNLSSLIRPSNLPTLLPSFEAKCYPDNKCNKESPCYSENDPHN